MYIPQTNHIFKGSKPPYKVKLLPLNSVMKPPIVSYSYGKNISKISVYLAPIKIFIQKAIRSLYNSYRRITGKRYFLKPVSPNPVVSFRAHPWKSMKIYVKKEKA